MKQIVTMFAVIIFLCKSLISQERLSSKQFKKKLDASPQALLLDVRTSQEINKGYLKGAVFIDFYDSSFKEQVNNIDKDRPVFVYCAIGGRSWDAAKLMQEMGFREVYDLKGGIILWKIKNYPFVKLKSDSARQGITRKEFEKSFTESRLTFVDFYAPWCAPCKIMLPALDSIKNEMKDSVTIVKVNADENLQLMKEYDLQALPYVMLMRGNKILFRKEGFVSGTEMREVIRKFYQP